MTDSLASAAALFLTRGDDGRYTITAEHGRHLGTIIEATALVDEPSLFKEKVGDLLRLVQVLRTQEEAPAAAAAIESALHASPAAVAALGLSRPVKR